MFLNQLSCSRKGFLQIIFFFLFGLCFSQTKKQSVETIFEQVEKKYNERKEFSYNVKYSLYSDSKQTKAIESYQSTILKLNGVQYQKMQNIELVDFGDRNVVVTHDDKVIQVSNIENKNYPTMIATYLKIFSKTKLEEDSEKYICTLYEEKLNQSNIKQIKVYIKKSDYSLIKQEFYFFGENEKQTPKLEVIFSTRKIELPRDSELIKKSNYFKVVSGNIKSSDKFKDYKLVVH